MEKLGRQNTRFEESQARRNLLARAYALILSPEWGCKGAILERKEDYTQVKTVAVVESCQQPDEAQE